MNSDEPDLKWKLAAAVLSVVIVVMVAAGIWRGGLDQRSERLPPGQSQSPQSAPTTNAFSGQITPAVPSASPGDTNGRTFSIGTVTSNSVNYPATSTTESPAQEQIGVIYFFPRNNIALQQAISSHYTNDLGPDWLLLKLTIRYATGEELTNAVMSAGREHFKAEGKPPPDWLVDMLNGPGVHGTITVTAETPAVVSKGYTSTFMLEFSSQARLESGEPA